MSDRYDFNITYLILSCTELIYANLGSNLSSKGHSMQ